MYEIIYEYHKIIIILPAVEPYLFGSKLSPAAESCTASSSRRVLMGLDGIVHGIQWDLTNKDWDFCGI